MKRPKPEKGKPSLYDPKAEKDSCGIGFVADLKGKPARHIVEKGLGLLCRLTHRGAVGADPLVSDGVGILTRLPDEFFRSAFSSELPKPGEYAVTTVFLPFDEKKAAAIRREMEKIGSAELLNVKEWRRVPVRRNFLGKTIRRSAPLAYQALLLAKNGIEDQEHFERKLYIFRQRCGNRLGRETDFHIPSCSSRTIVYKSMTMAESLPRYYPDLNQKTFASPLALVHQRFSTNTFPSWSLAQPFRLLCHNGEINTLRGNLNWMRAREQIIDSPRFGSDLKKLFPLIKEGLSDSACLDRALEFLLAGGYSPGMAIMTLIPQAWQGDKTMNPRLKAFYRSQAAVMEPWDGPAAVAFTDGRQIGAVLDRNGLRPIRTLLTADGLLALSSEAGVLDIPDEEIILKGRLDPGEILLADLEQGRIIKSDEVKQQLAHMRDWAMISGTAERTAAKLPKTAKFLKPRLTPHLKACFGYTREDEEFYLKPMLKSGAEPVGSMGVDTPPSALSATKKLLYTYFKQCFAQVTNPAIDPIRERLVMSLKTFVGRRPSLFGESGPSPKYLVAESPVIGDDLYRRLTAGRALKVKEVDICHRPEVALAEALEKAVEKAAAAVKGGAEIICLSDCKVGKGRVAIPALLATSAVHHGLIKRGLRFSAGLAVASGEVREPHHFAVLGGYGAELIYPWAALAYVRELGKTVGLGEEAAENNYRKALDKSLLKIMAKMGISTFQSYCGAQIFDSLGLDEKLVAKYFPGTTARIGGVGIKEIAADSLERHRKAWQKTVAGVEESGDYAFRSGGEVHAWTPQTVADLQHSVRGNIAEKYERFAAAINRQNERLLTLRGLLELVPKSRGKTRKLPLGEVESAENIVKRFSTGAMSFGSISYEAHSTLAVAMNRIGGKSNTGEGGEETERFTPRPNGDSARSAIKQVASGRFGVTAEYLANSDMIQIKICQGAKPGEGGQLPGHKVNAVIAAVRHSTPGVGLISPPPHHDIYSIEDLAQLIFDLKNVNPEADISVKLASEAGVGTVAAGVAKARADHITIAGYEGGTGASPLTSIKHAGLPWEIGLAETHQTLVGEGLRGRVSVQVDGGLRTGLDVVIAALLGADEFGFATAPLIAMGCLMMRKCHLNTCPVGIATQNPALRKRFVGLPEHVINYFFFVAEEVRGLMAKLGFRRFEDLVGKTECLKRGQTGRSKELSRAHNLLLTPLLARATPKKGDTSHKSMEQNHPISSVKDREFIRAATPALKAAKRVRINAAIGNTDRALGTMLSGRVAKTHGHKGLADDAIRISLKGVAGQSLGAFLARGITLDLSGEGNDYVGKGLSGGRIIIKPPSDRRIRRENVIIGNTVLYGALEGELYASGLAGERFAVRNSGAVAVVEGCGDHCCEYMTGGLVVCMGEFGRNLAAGMSGGIAYVYGGDRLEFADPIDIEPLKGESPPPGLRGKAAAELKDRELLSSPLAHDLWRLKMTLERHRLFTDSPLAAELLADWEKTAIRFFKLVPKDFRRAILATAKRPTEMRKSA